ncbi:MAG TPA: hypothetical protein VF765_16330 [Polyangiaceae bacterium]
MRADWRVALAVASFAPALVTACSLESLSGLTGGQGAGDAAETPDVQAEAAPPDDATTTDGSAMGDAPPDVTMGPGADAGPDGSRDARADAPQPEAGPWCQTHAHYFCSDWDEGSLNAQWTSVYSVGDGGVALDKTTSTSAPASFVATVPALPAGTTSHQALTHQFTFTPKSLDVAFDLRIDALDTSTSAEPTETVAIVFGSGANPYALQLNLVVGNTQLGEQRPLDGGGHTYDGWPFSVQPPMGVWTHYVIHMDLSSAPTAAVWMNDAGVVSHALTGYVAGAATLQVGVCYTPGATTGTQVHYDNVTLDYQ